MQIGFIGLGQMGSAIAGNLVKAGHEVTVWNRSSDKAKSLVAAGARQAGTPAGAAAGSVVFTMLANDEAVEQVVFGEDGVLASSARPIHVSMSTISVAPVSYTHLLQGLTTISDTFAEPVLSHFAQ